MDAGTEPHMLDLLIYRMEARTEPPASGRHAYQVAGRTCLAGDVFGTFTFPEKLEVGSLIAFADAAAYTMVKKNWFNGLAMPSIVVRRLDGRVEVVRTFGYEDYSARCRDRLMAAAYRGMRELANSTIRAHQLPVVQSVASAPASTTDCGSSSGLAVHVEHLGLVAEHPQIEPGVVAETEGT